jgi:hypothetical protein
MPGLTTAPNVIEQTDFSGGWRPDEEAAAVPPNGLLAALNLLPDVGSVVPQVRKGFKRLAEVLQGYRIESIHPYNRLTGDKAGQYLMLVLTNHLDGVPDNVQLWSLNLATSEVKRRDTTSVAWNSADGHHYGLTINQTFFGGGPGDPMYSWNPVDGYDRNPSGQDFPVLVNSNDPGTGQVAHNFAFLKETKVLYTDPLTGIQQAYIVSAEAGGVTPGRNRFKLWDDGGVHYDKDELVSHEITDGVSGKTYLRSFSARVAHTSGPAKDPGGGAGYWDAHDLDLPRDDEGEVTDDWDIVPIAATTNVAAWHADRMFLRYDNHTDSGESLLQYSFPLEPDAGGDIGKFVWDPTNFSPVKDEDTGDHGGWEPVHTGDGDKLTALLDYGYYLIIAKRRTTFVLAGLSPETWVLRKLGNVGGISSRAIAEHEGQVYILSDRGLYVTDGTQLIEAPGAERARDWLRQAVSWEQTQADGTVVDREVTMWSFGGYLWASVPTTSSYQPDRVLVYDANTKSLWLQKLAVEAAAVSRIDGVEELFFSSPTQVGEQVGATVAWDGVPGRSTSTRTLGDVTERNLWANPSFSVLKNETLTKARDNSGWAKHDSNADWRLSPTAALDGPVGAVIHNTNKPEGAFTGIGRSFTDESSDLHTLSAYVRPAAWKTRGARADYSNFRFTVGGDALPEWRHHYQYIGHGWTRAWAQYTGDPTVERPHGISNLGNTTFEVDKLLAEGQGGSSRPWFDGDRTDDISGTAGGDIGIVYQYNHPDVQETPTDDQGQEDYSSEDIGWSFRTAWFPFGMVHEVRRIRRIWAVIRGAVMTTIRGYRNFVDDPVFEKDRDAPDPTNFVEGLKMPDSFAVSFEVEGVGAPASVLGVAADTQPRRIVYHH